jgi:hypothetical protein
MAELCGWMYCQGDQPFDDRPDSLRVKNTAFDAVFSGFHLPDEK